VKLRIAVALIYFFLLAPIVIVVLAAFNSGAYLTFPPEGLSLRWFAAFFHSRPFTRSFIFSIELAAIATVLATLIGTGAAIYVARSRGRLLNLVRILMIAPLPVPGILTGIALLLFFYATGFATKGWPPMIVGHTLICLPYVFLVVSAVLVGLDPSLVEAARNLGAGPFTAFWRVTLPIVKGGVISGAIFAFITSFDEFNISLLLSGVDTVPLPIQLFDFLRFSFDPTAAVVGTISIAMAFAVVVLTERLVGLESLYWGGR
jgi:putative spermidine/putrescine transport system permease protein